MSNDFNNKIKIVPKEKKRGVFRLIGVVIPDLNRAETILGYVLLDVQNYKPVSVTAEQFITVLKNYTFENVLWDEKSKTIISTESNVKDYKKKVMQFNSNLTVIGNKGYTILAKIISGDEIGYKVLDYNLKVVDVREADLIQTVESNKVPLLNAKIVEGSYISALKDKFQEIQKEKSSSKNTTTAQGTQSKECHTRHLEKIIDRFKRSVIDRSTFNNLGVVDTFPQNCGNDKVHKRFKKDLLIYLNEYAKVKHPRIVEMANRIYGDEDEKLVGILIACMYVDTFINKKFTIERPFVGISKDWVTAQLFNQKFNNLMNTIVPIDLWKMVLIITGEQRFLISSEEQIPNTTFVDKSYYPRARTKLVFKERIIKTYTDSKSPQLREIYRIYSEGISNPLIKSYLSMLPICETISKLDKKQNNFKIPDVFIDLNMKSLKGVKAIGYCVNEKEAHTISDETVIYKNKRLRYIFSDIKVSKPEIKEIIKMSTCFGDMYFAAKLLTIREKFIEPDIIRNGDFEYYVCGDHFRLPKSYDFNTEGSEIINFVIESIMIILSIYNLDLALYLNKKYHFVNLDLESIGYEEFPLDDSDNAYYQTGGRFNKLKLRKNSSWSGLSNMPMGLRTAISLSATNSVPLEIEKLLNYLYI